MAFWDTSDMSEEEQEEVSSGYQEAEDNANSELASFLGESRYDAYETYMETKRHV
jgi:hypothetical protein